MTNKSAAEVVFEAMADPGCRATAAIDYTVDGVCGKRPTIGHLRGFPKSRFCAEHMRGWKRSRHPHVIKD